jgi:GNAT superfamily N-acetyltransferase
MPFPTELRLRPATTDDIALLLDLIKELALYEKEPDAALATPELLHAGLFGDSPTAEAVVAEWAGAPAGFALFFHNYSTWTGKPGLYLEDLFVREALRGKGIGKALLLHLATIARARGCGRMEWSVLDWNTPAIEFYEALGAKPQSEWTVYRLDEAALETLVG